MTPSRPSSRRPSPIDPLPALILAALLLAPAAPAHAAPVPSRLDDATLIATLGTAMRSDDLELAQKLIVEMERRFPDDPHVRYNAACIAARRGETADALTDLRAAADRGFRDVRRLSSDPDLASLRDDPGYAALVSDLETKLSAAAGRRSVRAAFGEWFEPGRLRDGDGRTSPLRVRLMVDDDGWHLEARGPAASLPAGDRAPEEGIELTIAAPDSEETFDTARNWRFGFTTGGTVPTGTALAQPGRRLDLNVLELAPVIARPTGGDAVLTAHVPWSYLSPYAPPADTLFGVNVVHRVRDDDGRLVESALVADPRQDDRAPGRRRFLALALPPGGERPRLQVKLSSTVAGTQPLTLTVAAWLPGEPPAGTLATLITDNSGRSVVSSGGTRGRISPTSGLNVWRRNADLSDLSMGPYRLSVKLDLEDGVALTWHAGLARIDQHWFASAHDRAQDLAPLDRPAIEYRLELIRNALQSRDRRASPAPLLSTIAEVEDYLSRSTEPGGILQPGEVSVTALDAGGGGWTPVKIALPPASRTGPLLLLLDVGGVAGARVFDTLARTITAGDTPVAAALPTLDGDQGRWSKQTSVEAAAIVDWLPRVLPGRPVLLVGVGAAPSWAADLKRARPDVVLDAYPGGLPNPAAAAAEKLLRWAESH